MEATAKLRKFFQSRRSKPGANHDAAATELDLHSVPYTTAPPPSRLPVFIHHALGKAPERDGRARPLPDLPALSYHATTAGKPPLVGDRPHRGNGPVKLQTGRRLSSGELLMTQQDYDLTLDDIRHGDYVVAAKDRRASHTSQQPTSPTSPTSPSLRVVSTAPNSPRNLSFPSSPWLPMSAASEPGPTTTAVYSPHAAYPFPGAATATATGLGISTPSPRHPPPPPPSASTSSLLGPNEEQNPTIQALWKAEYNRLVSIYGREGVDRNIDDINRARRGSAPRASPSAARASPSSLAASPLAPPRHSPSDGERRGLGVRNVASASQPELGYGDDRSDASSAQRLSCLSSSGGSSSFTVRTSIADDAVTSREDLRKIVDGMRMTYLHAIEAQTPPHKPLPDLPSRPSRSNKPGGRGLASSVSVESGLRSSSQPAVTRTKSWQSETTNRGTPRTSMSTRSAKSRSKRTSAGVTGRRTSQTAGAGVGTLPAIQASPSKSPRRTPRKDDNVGLKRADSTTLGSMAAGLTILDSRRGAPPETPSPTFDHSSGSESDTRLQTMSSASSLDPSPVKTAGAPPPPHTATATLIEPAVPPPSTKLAWQGGPDLDFVDSDIDLALDMDDFECLCDDMFNSSTLGTAAHGRFETWGGSEQEAGPGHHGHDFSAHASISPPLGVGVPHVTSALPDHAAPM